MFYSAFLIFSVATTALPIYEQERDIVYTMHTLEQDLADVPMVKQNIDMFIGVFQMNSQLLEKKLAIAHQKAKKALWTKGGVLVGATLGAVLYSEIYTYLMGQLPYKYQKLINIRIMDKSILALIYAAAGAIKFHFGLDAFNAFKKRNALKEALALDQEILEQLLTIKDLAMFSFDDDLSAEALAEGGVAEEAIDAIDASTEVAE